MKSKKLCECGCGVFTNVITKTQRSDNNIAGKPYRFLFGHKKTADQVKRFWSYVNKKGPIHPKLSTRCWVWTGAFFKTKGIKTYGSAYFKGKSHPANRVAWFLKYGEWPEYFACHHCDNKWCVNPSHLYDGTTRENAEDAIARGRIARGERNGSSKLKEQEVIELRRLLSTHTHAELAEKYNISIPTIDAIAQGKTWRYLLQ